jgi:hypothetical protein
VAHVATHIKISRQLKTALRRIGKDADPKAVTVTERSL